MALTSLIWGLTCPYLSSGQGFGPFLSWFGWVLIFSLVMSLLGCPQPELSAWPWSCSVVCAPGWRWQLPQGLLSSGTAGLSPARWGPCPVGCMGALTKVRSALCCSLAKKKNKFLNMFFKFYGVCFCYYYTGEVRFCAVLWILSSAWRCYGVQSNLWAPIALVNLLLMHFLWGIVSM